MDFSIKTFDAKTTILAVKTGCIAVGVYENKKLSPAAQQLDIKGVISAVLKSGDLTGKPGSTLLLRKIDGVTAERILLVGLGKNEQVTEKDFSSAVHAVVRVLASLGAADAVLALPTDTIVGRDAAWMVRCAVMAARDGAYRSDGLKSQKDDSVHGVKKLTIALLPKSKGNVTTAKN